MTVYTSIDDVASAFTQAAMGENEALFLQGQVIKGAVEQGFDVDETAAYCGQSVGKSKRTVLRRYSVARTFPIYDASKPWELYALASTAVDYRSKDATAIGMQQADANNWLILAIQNEWSTRQLRQAMKGQKVTDRIVLLDCAEAIIWNINTFANGKTELTLLLDQCTIEAGKPTRVQVTLVMQSPTVERKVA